MYKVTKSTNGNYLVTNNDGKTIEFAYDIKNNEVFPIKGNAKGFSYKQTEESILKFREENP